MIERKVCEGAQLKILDTDGSHGRLVGYASTFANVDRVNERVVKGAFMDTLPDFVRDGFIALDHDWKSRVATIDVAREDDHGLWVEADFHSTQDAQDARTKAMERMTRGKSVTLSIGYDVLDDAPDPETKGVRLLKKLNLFEVSLVSVPANPLALVAGAKDGLLAGLSMDAHSDAVLAAVKEYTERCASLRDLRAKEGRVLSAANRQKLEGLISQLQELMTATEPKADPEEVRKAVAQMLVHRARLTVSN